MALLNINLTASFCCNKIRTAENNENTYKFQTITGLWIQAPLVQAVFPYIIFPRILMGDKHIHTRPVPSYPRGTLLSYVSFPLQPCCNSPLAFYSGK